MRTLSKLLIILSALAVMAPAMAAPTYTESSDRFFLRGTGCGATEDLYLDDRSGEDEYDGCGVIGGLPVNEAIGGADSLSTRDTDSFILDGSGKVTIVIQAECWACPVPGAGQSVVDVSLSGTKASGGFIPVQLGSGTSEKIVAGAAQTVHTFTFDIPDTADKVEISDLTLDVSVRGVNVGQNNLGMSGDSFITIDTLELVEG